MDLSKCLVLLKDQDEGFSLESKGGGCELLWMSQKTLINMPSVLSLICVVRRGSRKG